jgi:hypothetical protein
MELNSFKPRTSEAARDFLMELSMRLLNPEEPAPEEREAEKAAGTISEAEIKEQLLRAIRAKNLPSQRLVIKSGSRMLFLHPEKIEWVEAEKDYVRLHVGKENHLVRNDERYREEAGIGPIRSGAPLDDREPGLCERDAAAAQRRVRHSDARRHPTATQPRISCPADGPIAGLVLSHCRPL